MGASRQQGTWPRQMFKVLNNTAVINDGERPYPTSAMLSALQVPSASRTIYTIAVQAASSAASKPEGGAKVDIELPVGQNQNEPGLEDTKSEVPVLPGVNQDTSAMGEVPKPVSPAVPPTSPQVSDAPAIIVNRPLPGQNQENPIVGDVSPPPVPTLATPKCSPSPSSTPPPGTSVMRPATTTSISTTPPPLVVQTVSMSKSASTSAASNQGSATMLADLLTPPSVTSFVTITRSEQGKLEAPVSIALPKTPSTTAITTSSVGAEAVGRATTQAVAAAQSASGVMLSTATVAFATSDPAPLPNIQGGSILHPTARTLLILFVILGRWSCGARPPRRR